MIRLQRYLSEAGVAARRKAEEIITAGRVTVNGRVVAELGAKVDPQTDTVAVDGRRVEPEDKIYFVLNKPKGFVSTVADPQGRRTVMELLPRTPLKGVRPIGRLDYDSRRGRFRGWLLGVTRNQLGKFLGRQKRQPRGSGDSDAVQRLEETPAPAEDEAFWNAEYKRQRFKWACGRVQGEVEPASWQAFANIVLLPIWQSCAKCT